MRIQLEEGVEFQPSHLVQGVVSGGVAIGFGLVSFWHLKRVSEEEIEAIFGKKFAKILPRSILADKTPAN